MPDIDESEYLPSNTRQCIKSAIALSRNNNNLNRFSVQEKRKSLIQSGLSTNNSTKYGESTNFLRSASNFNSQRPSPLAISRNEINQI